VVGLSGANVAEQWHRERRRLAKALPGTDLDALGQAFVTAAHTRAPADGNVADRVRRGVRAVELLPLAGVTSHDLLLAALQLPWCDRTRAGQPRVTSWADAVVLAVLPIDPRPGQYPAHARGEYARHVRALPADVRAVAAAAFGGADLVDGLPDQFRDAALRPPTLFGRLTGSRPQVPAPVHLDPITHQDAALAAARAQAPWLPAEVTVEEHDVGYLVWTPVQDQPGSVGASAPAVIVDRQTRAVTTWHEPSPHHALAIYAARHRLFPLLPGWGSGAPVAESLRADLARRLPTIALPAQLAEQYANELSYGTTWPATVDRWNVGTSAAEQLKSIGISSPDTLTAALLAPWVLGADEATARWYLDALPPDAARQLQGTNDREARAVTAAFSLAGARYARARFGGLCPLRRAELGRTRALTQDLPELDTALAAFTDGRAT